MGIHVFRAFKCLYTYGSSNHEMVDHLIIQAKITYRFIKTFFVFLTANVPICSYSSPMRSVTRILGSLIVLHSYVILNEQVSMFYHLKTRHCVSTFSM